MHLRDLFMTLYFAPKCLKCVEVAQKTHLSEIRRCPTYSHLFQPVLAGNGKRVEIKGADMHAKELLNNDVVNIQDMLHCFPSS